MVIGHILRGTYLCRPETNLQTSSAFVFNFLTRTPLHANQNLSSWEVSCWGWRPSSAAPSISLSVNFLCIWKRCRENYAYNIATDIQCIWQLPKYLHAFSMTKQLLPVLNRVTAVCVLFLALTEASPSQRPRASLLMLLWSEKYHKQEI